MDDEYFQELDREELERIEEGDDNPVAGPDEAEEAVETVRKVQPKKIIVKPRLKLDDKRLTGPRGLCLLEPIFKKTVLRGPGHEKEDLDTILSVLEHWALRLFPKMSFDDCLEKIEELGHKKSVSSYVTLLRMDCAESRNEVNEDVIEVRSRSPSPQPTVDPFDQLLSQPGQSQSQLSQEQKERIERNKLIALERRRAKLKAKYEKTNEPSDSLTNNLNNDNSNYVPSQIESQSCENSVNENENITDFTESIDNNTPSSNVDLESSHYADINTQKSLNMSDIVHSNISPEKNSTNIMSDERSKAISSNEINTFAEGINLEDFEDEF